MKAQIRLTLAMASDRRLWQNQCESALKRNAHFLRFQGWSSSRSMDHPRQGPRSVVVDPWAIYLAVSVKVVDNSANSPALEENEDTSRRFHALLEAGGDGLSTAFDMPILMGGDSDEPMSRGEVGRAGVAVDSLADIRILARAGWSARCRTSPPCAAGAGDGRVPSPASHL